MLLASVPEPERRDMQSSVLAFVARAVPTWRPALDADDTLIAEIEVFLKETRRRTGDPAVLASLMMRVDQAFLAEAYPQVRAAYERLLPRVLQWGFRFPAHDFEIPEHQLAARYLVAIYATTPLTARAWNTCSRSWAWRGSTRARSRHGCGRSSSPASRSRRRWPR
jgi:hypothetical protein